MVRQEQIRVDMNLKLVSYSASEIDSATLDEIDRVIPDDRLQQKRRINLRKAYLIVIARQDGDIAGVVFVRSIWGIPNVTWMVSAKFQRRGIAQHLLSELQKKVWILTAFCRNEPSVKLAKRAGFWMFPGHLALWVKRKV